MTFAALWKCPLSLYDYLTGKDLSIHRNVLEYTGQWPLRILGTNWPLWGLIIRPHLSYWIYEVNTSGEWWQNSQWMDVYIKEINMEMKSHFRCCNHRDSEKSSHFWHCNCLSKGRHLFCIQSLEIKQISGHLWRRLFADQALGVLWNTFKEQPTWCNHTWAKWYLGFLYTSVLHVYSNLTDFDLGLMHAGSFCHLS